MEGAFTVNSRPGHLSIAAVAHTQQAVSSLLSSAAPKLPRGCCFLVLLDHLLILTSGYSFLFVWCHFFFYSMECDQTRNLSSKSLTHFLRQAVSVVRGVCQWRYTDNRHLHFHLFSSGQCIILTRSPLPWDGQTMWCDQTNFKWMLTCSHFLPLSLVRWIHDV